LRREHYPVISSTKGGRSGYASMRWRQRAAESPGERLLSTTIVSLEIPAGGIDAGESPEEAVSRELREETGCLPQKMERLGGFYSVPGYGTEYLYLYLATDLTPGRLFAEDTESISVVRVPISQILELITSGSICDAKSIAGLLTFLEYLKRSNG